MKHRFGATVVLGLLLSLAALSATATSQGRVMSGASVLLADSLHLLEGKNIGLLCNHTSILPNGTHLLDTLLSLKVCTVRTIFEPEHSFSGMVQAGEKTVGGKYKGIPIVSLYGNARKPAPKSLAGLDVLVIDLQDVGARFYTYISTLGLCMQAAAEAGVPVLVLDRPNPVNAAAVEGPVLDTAKRSFIGMYPIPIRYGMTIGELALAIRGEGWLENVRKADIRIVPMKGYRRSMFFAETGLLWIPPSPNIPDPITALVYQGTCLIEGLNVSEGRGTDSPFLLIGAPFLDEKRLADAMNRLHLPGVRFAPAVFVPQSLPAARSPKFLGDTCRGVRITVTDSQEFRPVDAALHLIRQMRILAGKRITFSAHFSLLTGDRRLVSELSGLTAPKEIQARRQAGVDRFLRIRKRHLIYE